MDAPEFKTGEIVRLTHPERKGELGCLRRHLSKTLWWVRCGSLDPCSADGVLEPYVSSWFEKLSAVDRLALLVEG